MDKTIGIIGLDTSHVEAFTRILNDEKHPGHIAGAKVVVAYPGGSKDIPLSNDRVAGFTKKLQDEFAVKIVQSPKAVAEACDLLFIETIDGRVHMDLLRQTIQCKRPTFIDKPLCNSYSEAREMFRMAREAGIPLMSCSSLRFSETLTAALEDQQNGAIVGCDAFGPCSELPTPPGLFWYGLHTVEPIFRVMGTGCVEVRATRNADGEVIVGTWSDGRMASLRGMRKGHSKFGMTVHREKGFQQMDLAGGGRALYEVMLEAILNSLPAGKSGVPEEQTLELIRFIEAANESRVDGKTVRL